MGWLQWGAQRNISSPPSPTGAEESPTALGCFSVGFCLVLSDPGLDPTSQDQPCAPSASTAPHYSHGSQASSTGFDIGGTHGSPTEPGPSQTNLLSTQTI